MANVQQPEMRRTEQTPLVQDSQGPQPPRRGGHSAERRTVPAEQTSPYGPGAQEAGAEREPDDRDVEGG
jgi:hypothetical protein